LDLRDSLDVCKMNNHWGLKLMQAVEADRFILEFLGKIILIKDYDYNNLPMDERFLILRTNQNENNQNSSICLDARNYGNKARFIRRSCVPNSYVKYFEVGKEVHAGIFSLVPIECNTEITIDFDSEWTESKSFLSCVCNLGDCKISAWFKHRQSRAMNVLSELKALSFSSDNADSEEEVKRKKRKKAVALSHQSYNERNKTIDDYSEPQVSSEKMSREERKIAMLMKSFQKMENRQNRKRKPTEVDRRTKKVFPRKKKIHYANGTDTSNDTEESYSDGEKSKEEEKLQIEKVDVAVEMKNDTNDKPLSSNSKGEGKVLRVTQEMQEKETLPDLSSHSSPGRSSHKFGKKAWILEFQEKEKEANSEKIEESSIVSKFPVKKKMLGSFLQTDQKSPIGDLPLKHEEDFSSNITNNFQEDTKKDSLPIPNLKSEPSEISTHGTFLNSFSSANSKQLEEEEEEDMEIK